jgi:opacity protein-like surface antigen
MRHRIGLPAALALAALVSLPVSALAFAGFSASADLGYGTGHLESRTGTSMTSWGVGLGLPLGPAQWIEVRSTGTGTPFEHGVTGAAAGELTVQTLTGGLKVGRMLFANGGLGVGRAEVAPRRTATTFVEGREHTGLAYTLGLGYRFGNAGPLGIEVAYRMHGLLEKDRSSSDFARVFTIGFAF